MLQISYFAYFGHVWLLSSKLIIQLVAVLMFIFMQKMNSIPNFFLRYCKDIANLLL